MSERKKITEVVKDMQLEDAIDLLAQGIEYLIQVVNDVKRGPAGPTGATGADSTVPGPVGERGRDAKIAIGRVTSSDTASATLEDNGGVQILHLSLPKGDTGARGQASTVPGPAGRDGKDGQSIIGPVGKSGRDGRDGVDGKSARIVLGTVVSGDKAAASLDALPENTYRLNLTLPRGAQGESLVGPVGPQGELGGTITAAEITKLVENVIGNCDNEMIKQFMATKREIDRIESDTRYHRIAALRSEIVGRLKQHYEPGDGGN